MGARRERRSSGEDQTRLLPAVPSGADPRTVLREVYAALAEKGYDPIHQIVGYLLSGDPAYITTHRNARALIRGVGREELLEGLVRDFLSGQEGTR